MWPITARRLYKGKMNCLIKKVSSPNARTVSVVAGIEDSGISKGVNERRRCSEYRSSRPRYMFPDVSAPDIGDLCISVILIRFKSDVTCDRGKLGTRALFGQRKRKVLRHQSLPCRSERGYARKFVCFSERSLSGTRGTESQRINTDPR